MIINHVLLLFSYAWVATIHTNNKPQIIIHKHAWIYIPRAGHCSMKLAHCFLQKLGGGVHVFTFKMLLFFFQLLTLLENCTA